MTRPLRVPLIEGSDDDAALIVHELENGGFDVDYERIDASGGAREALKRRDWDPILSDHAMPGTCSLEALTIAKESEARAPFIIVSGWMTDELAESAIREGARAFVPKNRLSRLVPTVKKELGKKRRRAPLSGKKGKKKR